MLKLQRDKIFRLKNGAYMKFGGSGFFGGDDFYEVFDREKWNIGSISAKEVDSETVKMTILMPENDEIMKDAVNTFIKNEIKPLGYTKIWVNSKGDLKYYEGKEVIKPGTFFTNPIIKV